MEKLTIEERRRRRFSESFKRKKVQEIESGQTKISEICRVYQIRRPNVERWRRKYGS
ncbi:MAG: transposase, partial [Bacteroidales bacterium]|nr:transposase [Bacteroidales bacterium]